jgi:dCTP deaminase
MSIMSDRWITRMATEHGMIVPFEGRQVREGVISYGVSSYGYDMRVAREFRIFTNVMNSIVDPKNFDPSCFVAVETDVCIVRSSTSASRATSSRSPSESRRTPGAASSRT